MRSIQSYTIKDNTQTRALGAKVGNAIFYGLAVGLAAPTVKASLSKRGGKQFAAATADLPREYVRLGLGGDTVEDMRAFLVPENVIAAFGDSGVMEAAKLQEWLATSQSWGLSSVYLTEEIQKETAMSLLRQESALGEWDFKRFMERWQNEKLPTITESRMKLVFEQNTRTAQQAAQWGESREPDIIEVLKGYVYRTMDDNEVRPNHSAMNGRYFPKGSAALNSIWPPNGYNCRCYMEEVYEWDDEPLNPWRGRVHPDPGFDRNVGADLMAAKDAPAGSAKINKLME
jgi:SPP1 gp7 family putative phage head morphogenesis protein